MARRRRALAGPHSPCRRGAAGALELAVPGEPGPLEAAILDAPWEVLSEGGAPLAGNRTLVLCPLRRLGERADEEEPSPESLLAVLMAAQPEGVTELAFEEEESAILAATGGLGMDLHVEESGSLDRLSELLGKLGRVDVVHLSCHGGAEPVPTLVVEDDVGTAVLADADRVDKGLQPHRSRVLFLSACLTAAADSLLGSLAATLVRRGVPALLGWGGSVYDHEATRFAAELYRQLSRRARLDEAVAGLELLTAEDLGRPARDWHQARLFLGPRGGGALTLNRHQRRVRDRRQAVAKAFLDARQQVPVASPEEFVGRRRPLQRILRAFREGRAGVLIQGMGRLGKSSLALRVVDGLSDHRPVVLHGPFDARALLDAIAEAVADPRARQRVRELREDASDGGALSDGLVGLLAGFGAQADGSGKPLLVVLDDFEQLLEETDPAPKRCPSVLESARRRSRGEPRFPSRLALMDPRAPGRVVLLTLVDAPPKILAKLLLQHGKAINERKLLCRSCWRQWSPDVPGASLRRKGL